MSEEPDDDVQIVVCQGQPRCDKEGEEAVEAAKAGCVWCERHTLLPTGEWQITKPGNA